MNPIYLGVDVAGASNTWVAGLSAEGNSLRIVVPPARFTLEQIVTCCQEHDVLAVAIDAQLTMALSEEKGFRTSDLQLRRMLPSDCRNWVASINSLMAVPVRGKLLSDFLSPLVGTILETHPRACLLFGLDEAVGRAVREYKKGPSAKAHVATLWERWAERFQVVAPKAPQNDGALDALVCATVAYLFHHAPETLLRLKHRPDEGKDRPRGRGPFYVLAPAPGSEACGG